MTNAPSSGQSFPLCLQSYNLCSYYYCNTTSTTTRAGRPLRPIAFFLRSSSSSIAFDYLSLTRTFIFQSYYFSFLKLSLPKSIFQNVLTTKRTQKKARRILLAAKRFEFLSLKNSWQILGCTSVLLLANFLSFSNFTQRSKMGKIVE